MNTHLRTAMLCLLVVLLAGVARLAVGAQVARSGVAATHDLTGVELADQLGLKPIPFPKGSHLDLGEGPLVDCPPSGPDGVGPELASAGQVDENGNALVYCIRVGPGGVAQNAYEMWDIGKRLGGNVPTDIDRQAQVLEFRSEELSAEGDEQGALEMAAMATQLRNGGVTLSDLPVSFRLGPEDLKQVAAP